jgi:FtsH-binding integral membrane protein
MFFCPFCRANVPEDVTFCPKCGYSTVLSLPFHPLIRHKSGYVVLAFLSMVLGITSCLLSFFPYFYIIGIILVVPCIAFGAISLEGIANKLNGKLIRLVAITGLVLGVLSYIFNIFINSEVGTSSGL